MNNKFFTTGKGLTSTKASFTADSIKNFLLPLKEKIENVVFFTTYTQLITSSNKVVTQLGIDDLGSIKDNIELQGALYGLSAWLREAIKQKDTALNEIRRTNLVEWMEKTGVKIPTSPNRPTTVTEADIMSSWEPTKLARYYSLEAKSAHYSYINPDGSLYKANKELQKALNCPYTPDGKGQDTIILSYEPSVDPSKVTLLIEDLRQTKGSYESELNSMKAELKRETDRINLENNQAYQKTLREYHESLQAFEALYEAWQIEETARISALKIVIPENLQFAMTWLKTQQQEIAEE